MTETRSPSLAVEGTQAMGRGQRFGSWLQRWWPVAANGSGTVLLCLWGLLLLDVDHPSTRRLIIVWVAGLVGALLYVGSLVIDKRRGILNGRKLDRFETEQQGRVDAEERLNRLLIAVEGGLRNQLMSCAQQLGFTERERISMYAHEGEEFVRYARYCQQATLNAAHAGARRLPADEGLIGDSFNAGPVSRYTVHFDASQASSDRRLQWESTMQQMGSRPLTGKRATRMRMESTLYLFAPLTTPATGERVGILVVESLDGGGVKQRAFSNLVKERSVELVNALQAFRDAKTTVAELPARRSPTAAHGAGS